MVAMCRGIDKPPSHIPANFPVATGLKAGVLDDDTAKKVRDDARQPAIAARSRALADPMPESSGVEDGVYAP